MIDIVTVVFEPEIPVLRLQAQSIDLYCSHIGVRSIYVIVNDSDAVAQQIDPAWWGRMSHLVRVVPRSVFSTEFVDNGWVSQQVLKILGAATSYNTWSMVLDAKTIFVRHLLLDRLFDAAGKVTTGRLPIYPVFEPSRLIVNNLFNIDLAEQIGPGGVPFFFHNSTVRSMISDVGALTNKSFPPWFQEQGRLTEFLLYSGYVQHKFGTFDHLYSQHNSVIVCNVCHSEVEMFESKLSRATKMSAATVSVHRNAWTNISAEQKQQYRKFLMDRKITWAEHL